MTDNDMILRLLADNFLLKDQLKEALKNQKESEESSMLWYHKYTELEQKAGAKQEADDIPLSPGGLKNKCDMTTA